MNVYRLFGFALRALLLGNTTFSAVSGFGELRIAISSATRSGIRTANSPSRSNCMETRFAMKNESIAPEVFEVATYVGDLIRAHRVAKMLGSAGFNVIVEEIDIERDAGSIDVFRFATLVLAGHSGEWRFTYCYDLPCQTIEIRTDIPPQELPANQARQLFNLFESSRLAGFGLVLNPSNRGGIDVTGVSFRIKAKDVDRLALIGSLQPLAKFADETLLRLRGDAGSASLPDHWNEHLLRQ